MAIPVVHVSNRFFFTDTLVEARIMGGQAVNSNSMSYVTKLEFQESEVTNQFCVGTVVHKFFIATTKYCCESGNSVKIS